MTAVFEFPALEATKILEKLDAHRQRQVLAFIFERYGYSLQPSTKKIAPTPSPNHRGEFAAVEQLCELLDDLANQQGPMIAFLAASYNVKATTSYKPPSGGPARKRSYKAR